VEAKWIAMEIEVLGTFRNSLLDRHEVRFEVRHANEPTPKVYELRKSLSSMLATKLETTFITKVETNSGSARSRGIAHLYQSEERAARVEPEHVIILNMEPSARKESLKQLAQRRAEARSAVKKGGKK